MALNELKIDIAEKYLENIAKGIYNRVKAVEEIHPTIKHKKNYAYKLWRDKEFRLYLAERSKELMADRYNFRELADESMKRVREMVALDKRTIVEFSQRECKFETLEGHFPNSKEAIGFSEVFRRFSSIAMEADDLKAILEEEKAERENKKFAEEKKNRKRDQDRDDKRLEMDIERFEVDRQKIMNEEKKSDPKKLIIEVLD